MIQHIITIQKFIPVILSYLSPPGETMILLPNSFPRLRKARPFRFLPFPRQGKTYLKNLEGFPIRGKFANNYGGLSATGESLLRFLLKNEVGCIAVSYLC
ncbi:MAG TPA: hypothetical protein DGC94_05385 [Prolixibacteraceae bacterium]|nr:MAG: hypothetical protein A2W92_05320 [Bacteroidetes bacterium GWA2_42_15]HCU60522.1 hypothetical protein [Prolixibacteraceae bacterium]